VQCKTRDDGQVFVSYLGEYAGWRSYLVPSVPPFIAPCQRCGSSHTYKREEQKPYLWAYAPTLNFRLGNTPRKLFLLPRWWARLQEF
jgi:hypothetical protein